MGVDGDEDEACTEAVGEEIAEIHVGMLCVGASRMVNVGEL